MKSSSEKRELLSQEECIHFKKAVKSLMNDASKVPGEIELLSHGTEIQEKTALLNHYLDYTRRLCERDRINDKTILFLS